MNSSPCSYVRKTYSVPAEIGRRVIVKGGSVKIVSVWDWDDDTIASAPTPRAAIDKAMKELKEDD